MSCCNFAQGIARILCRTFPKRVGKTHRIALFLYAAYRWKNAQVTPGTVAIYTGLAVFGLFATLRRLLSAQENGGGMHRLQLVEHTGLRC